MQTAPPVIADRGDGQLRTGVALQTEERGAQFTDLSNNTNLAYVGKRTTGTDAGDYLIVGPGWKGTVPRGMAQISSPNDSVLVIGRVFVASDSDLPTAYALSKQIQLVPPTIRQPSQ